MCLEKLQKHVFKKGEEENLVTARIREEVFNLEGNHFEYYLSIKGLFMYYISASALDARDE